MEAAKSFGSRLFNAIFAGDVRSTLAGSVSEAERQGALNALAQVTRLDPTFGDAEGLKATAE